MAYTLANLQSDIRDYTEVSDTVLTDNILKNIIINSENTIIMARGLAISGLSGNHSWSDMIKDLEHKGFTIVNTNECHATCSDKWMNQIVFEREGIRTPKTVRVTHSEGYEQALDELDSKFPIKSIMFILQK